MKGAIARRCGLIALSTAGWAVIASVASAAEVPAIRAVRALAPPTIDGKLIEPCWRSGTAASGFKLLRTGKLAGQPTDARVACDDENLYVAFVCRDDQMDRLVATVTTRDGEVFRDDCVELFLAPRSDPVPYYHLLVNPLNTQRDEVCTDTRWNARWTSAVSRETDRWVVEIALPFRELPLDAASLGPWRINLAREQTSRAEVSSWAPCASLFHEPSRFGTLTGLDADLSVAVRRQLTTRLTDLARETASTIRQVPGTLNTPLARAARKGLDELAARLAKLADGMEDAKDRSGLLELQTGLAAGEAELAGWQRRMGRIHFADAVRAVHGPRTAWGICQVSTMVKLPADAPFEGKPASIIKLALAGRETEAAQIVVVPLVDALERLRVSVGRLEQVGGQGVIPGRDVTVRRVGYVRTKRATAGASFPPGLLPDPLLPDEPVDVPADGIQPFWLTVHAPLGTPAGTYRGELRVGAAGRETQILPIEVRVFGFDLPHRPALRTAFQLIPAYLGKRHGVCLAENTVAGWTTGVWSGADVKGRADYFGQGVFQHAVDRAVRHRGRQSVRIAGEKVVRGTHEGPRASFHTGPIPLEKGRTYRFDVWYKTDKLTGLADAWVSGGAGGVVLEPATNWRHVERTFTPAEDVEVYVYLRNHAVGTVWFDDARLIDTKTRRNLLPSPGFEEPPGKRGADLLREYRMSMLAHRISDINVAHPTIAVDGDGKVDVDWEDFDRQIQSYLIHGLNAFNVRWLRIGGGWGKVATPTEKRDRAVAARIIAETERHLLEKEWIDLAYVYVFDEPGPDARNKIVDAFRFVHQHAPRLRTLLTYGYGATKPWTHTKPDGPEAGYAAYADAVDIHVPHIDCCDWRVLDRLRDRAQKELWHYVCISAKRPYPNLWAIDYTGVDNRVVYWQLWKYGLTGTLYWCVNYWKQDVWKDPMSYPGGNGDGSLYYPGKTGPIESIRLELTRDGIDDYDYLKLLAGLVAEPPEGAAPELIERAKALIDVTEVCTSFTDYATDPSVIEQRRLALAEMIERLTRIGRAR